MPSLSGGMQVSPLTGIIAPAAVSPAVQVAAQEMRQSSDAGVEAEFRIGAKNQMPIYSELLEAERQVVPERSNALEAPEPMFIPSSAEPVSNLPPSLSPANIAPRGALPPSLVPSKKVKILPTYSNMPLYPATSPQRRTVKRNKKTVYKINPNVGMIGMRNR